MISIPHREAAGTEPASSWEVDGERRVIILAHAGVAVDIPVATVWREREGSYSLAKRSDFEWQLWPARFFFDRGHWHRREAPFDPAGRLDTVILLTLPNDRARAELERL